MCTCRLHTVIHTVMPEPGQSAAPTGSAISLKRVRVWVLIRADLDRLQGALPLSLSP
jgi:hypothetical protein